ncbi:MAG: hypothetical protein ACLGI9_05300, partial [Thermoanaerobaculia bacterium]
KRGQNVRLASELIGSRIDIKSESDVKDEVADALARMLKSAMGEAAPAPAPIELDVAAAPGVSEALAQKLRDAGYGAIDTLAETEPETLLDLDLDELTFDLAESIVGWAREEAERVRASLDVGPFRATEAPATSMADEDFMAALSRAFAESEQQRASRRGPEDGEEAEEVAEGTEESQ